MKKLNKLFAMFFAVLGVGTLSAQTDVTSTYLTNADFSSTDGWTAYVSSGYRDYGQGNIGGALGSYAASTTDDTHLSSERFFGFQCRWNGNYASYNQETLTELPAGVYTLSYDVENVNGSTTAAAYSNLFYVKVGDNTFTDTSVEWMKGSSNWTSHAITFVTTEATKATISLGYGTGSNNFATANTPVLYVSHLKLTYTNTDDISTENTADLTSYIVNNSFETGDLTGWTVGSSSDTGVKPNSNGTYTTSGVHGNYLFNTWWQGVPLVQTVANLPNGKYTLNVLLASDVNANLFLLANDEHSTVQTITGDKSTFIDASFDFTVLDGQAKIGVVGGNDAGEYVEAGHWWYKADNFRLTYKGADLTLLQEAFAKNYAALKELSTDNVSSAFANQITSLLSTYETTPDNKADLNTANAEITAVVNAHPSIVAAYGNLQELITLCTEYTQNSNANSDEVLNTFNTAISTATTNGNAATTVDAINSAYDTLETARKAYIQEAYPTSGNTFDFSYLLEGADWDNNSGVKTIGGITIEEKYAENPWTGDVMWDEISGLANGMYNVEVYLSASAAEWNHTSVITDGDQNTSITVNNVKASVGVYKRKSVSSPDVVTLTDVMVKDGTMDFKITNDVEGANWVIVAHKSITMTGKIDNTALQNQLTALLATANGIKDSDMNSTAETNLTTAIEAADVASEDPDALEKMIEDLTTTIDAAETSIAEYTKLKMYIDMTAVFTDVTTYQTKYDNGEYTSDDVDPVRKELNVKRYNAASEVFTNKVEVTGWTGDLANNQLSSQHWSGESRYYYDANSWTDSYVGLKHTLSTTVKLPNGKYVLKAAGRSSSDATLRLNIKNGETTLETVEYTGKGDTGYGIDTSGAANFSAEGTYANGDAGRGWEWEFAQFELDAETEVTLHVEVDYNSIQNRFGSFSDITLWMDDATYVTVYGKELDAPLAEAKALVNTLPMGEDENTALTNAIALGEGEVSTPAQLNAAVDALETAVANANAWRNTYYTEKDKLVAALERFEADYNNAENGAIDYMNKDRWATVITKAQAAAEAKDDLTSHEGLTTATTDLVAALDAADTSIAEYAALKEAIENATALVNGINWGDKPFQRPESAKDGLDTTDEQALYDAAEADGDGVTTVTDALNAAMDITLNVPDGVFYLNVASNGHVLLGKSVVASLGTISEGNPTGYGFNAATVTANYRPKVFTFTQAEENSNLYNISVELEAGTVYLTYGSLNGSTKDWATSQIQGNTEQTKAGTFKIEASPAVEGAFRIVNTLTNAYIACEDGGALYTNNDTGRADFALADASTVSVDINISAENQLSTCVLMFDAELPEGLDAYVFESYNDETNHLILKVIEDGVLPAYTPCLLYAENGYTGTLSGTVVTEEYAATVNKDGGYLNGAIEAHTITEGYLLQNQGEGVKFHTVSGIDGGVVVPAGKCWLTVTKTGAVSYARSISFSFRGGAANNIEELEVETPKPAMEDGAIYTLDGKRVKRMERGQVYIINGQKVMIK